MSTVLEETAAQQQSSHRPVAERLRTTMAAVRLSFTWLGNRKSLTAQQRERAADSFGAEGKYLSAGK